MAEIDTVHGTSQFELATTTMLSPEVSIASQQPIPPSQEEVEETSALFLPRQMFKDPSWMTKNVGERIHLIAHWEVKASIEPVASTEGYEFLCSYSWIQIDAPTIYVPGTPARWTPPPLPKQLAPDEGYHWCDQHGHRVRRHQFEPVFQALAVMNPCIRFNDVDVVVNRNTLMKLFDFASFKRGKAQFHVDLNMVGNTLFIGRKEKKPKRYAGSGYGRNFETEFTTEDSELPGAEGHHRVIRYKLSGLNAVVRIEADSYYTECEEDEESPNESFCRMFESSTRTTIPHDSPRPTHVLTQGTRVPHNITMELKSNSSKSQSMEQLWFGRTPYLCCAKQKQGLVQAANVIRLKQRDFEDWETKNQKHLLRLSWLLNELRRITVEKTSRGAAVMVMIERGAPLQVYEAKETYGALPKEIIERFWD